jgi:hypothetical protein
VLTEKFCKNKVKNFITERLIEKGVLNENFELIRGNIAEERDEQIQGKFTREINSQQDKKEIQDAGEKIENSHYLDKKRKKIKIKGQIYEFPDSWVRNGIENWDDFKKYISSKVEGKYKEVTKDFLDNLSNVIDGLNSIDLEEIMEDIIVQYGFLEATYVKYMINMDFSDEENIERFRV